MTILCDTNICVLLLRGGVTAQTLTALYLPNLPPASVYVSVVTVGELYSLAIQWNWGPTRWDAIDEFLQRTIVIDINDDLLLMTYARLDVLALQQGKTLGKNDLWIAATASLLNLTLLTTDADFDCLGTSGLQVIRIDPHTGLPTP
jgi:tRNA(fMet)-specific endonuclease VapC